MRCRLLLGALLLGLVPASLQGQGDEDKVVEGKRASEWVNILASAKEVTMRRRALAALEKAGPQTRKIFEEVGSALRLDSDERIRAMAALTLGTLGAQARADPERAGGPLPVKPGVDALMAALSKEKSARVRRLTAVALGRIGLEAREAVPTLGAALKDESPEVRAAAAEALFRIGPSSRDAVKELAAAVRDSKTKELYTVRLNAAMTLQRIGRPDGLPAVPDLIAALREEAPANLSPEERRQLTDVRRQMIETLEALGDVAANGILTETFRDALKTKNVALGRASLTALTKLAGDRKALLPVLIEAMAPKANQLQDQFIRCEAMHHIGQLGKELGDQREVVVLALQSALKDRLSEVRLAAIFALGELGPQVVGKYAGAIVDELKVLKRSSEKAIAEAAEGTIQKLQK